MGCTPYRTYELFVRIPPRGLSFLSHHSVGTRYCLPPPPPYPPTVRRRKGGRWIGSTFKGALHS